MQDEDVSGGNHKKSLVAFEDQIAQLPLNVEMDEQDTVVTHSLMNKEEINLSRFSMNKASSPLQREFEDFQLYELPGQLNNNEIFEMHANCCMERSNLRTSVEP